MLTNFQKHINQNFSFLKRKKLLIAISGGIDSVVLTSLLYQLKYDIALAHCNFKLRGEESDLDEEFIKNMSQDLDLPFFSISFNTEGYANKNNLSIQMAARKLRYQWFEKIAKNEKFDYVLTAHHKDDVLETFLINFTRGTGLDGLTGIPPINNHIIRPLLPFSRQEIEKYAIENDIQWREDNTNKSNKYLRNKIRHQVTPILKEINPMLMVSFEKTLQNLNQSKLIISDRIEQISKQIITECDGILKFNINKLKTLSNTKAYLFQLLKPYGFTEWNDVENLLNAQSGKQVISKTHRLVKDRTYLLLSNIEGKTLDKCYIEENLNEFFNSDIHLTFNTINRDTTIENQKEAISIDKSLLKFPLTVRKWENGDYFYPLGMQGKKKLSKFFKDEKFSILEKEKTWLLCNANNDIIWVIGKRLDNRYKITNSTTKVLKINLN